MFDNEEKTAFTVEPRDALISPPSSPRALRHGGQSGLLTSVAAPDVAVL